MIERLTAVEQMAETREPKTEDLFDRLGVLAAPQIALQNYPETHPLKVFNGSFFLDADTNTVHVLTRVILGYYRYVSVITHFQLPLNEVISGMQVGNPHIAQIVLGTDTPHDFWGAEDPRVQVFEDHVYATYAGRSRWFFDQEAPRPPRYRIMPLVARATRDNPLHWEKIGYFRLHEMERGDDANKFMGTKNTVLHLTDDTLYVFHRPYYRRSSLQFGAVISHANIDSLQPTGELKEIPLSVDGIACKPAKFELKIGWGPAPVEVSHNELLMLLHGVDVKLKCYRVFAMLLKKENHGLKPVAITPHYIMEPREPYEKYGDRAMVVFPCGAQVVDDQLLISYGAADSFLGFAQADLSTILSLLDNNRME